MVRISLEILEASRSYFAFISGTLAKKWEMTFGRHSKRCVNLIRKKHVGYKIGIGITVLANAGLNRRVQDVIQLNVTDVQTLTYSYLLKQSATDTVSSVLRMLMLTTTASLEAENEYQKALGALISLTEYSLEILGNEYAQDESEQRIIAARAAVESCKQICNDLELFMINVKRLVEDAAEAAFRVDAEYVVTLASENLLSSSRQIELIKQKSRELETQHLQLSKKVISVSSKHAESLRKEKKKESSL